MALMNTPIPFSKPFFPALLPILREENYKRVSARYSELYTHHPFPQDSILKKHLIENILPGLALYQIINEQEAVQNDALKVLDLILEQVYEKNIKNMRVLGRLPFIYPLLRCSIKTIMRSYPESGWQTQWLQNDKQAVRFNMNSCFYANTLSTYGAPELTASFCRLDDLTYAEMSPYLAWNRTQTIGRGAAYCDFCFARKLKMES